MRFCEECGAPLEDDAKFCEECGTPVEPLTADEDSPAIEETKPKEEKMAENQPDDMKKDQAAIEANMSVFSKEEELAGTPSAYEQPANVETTQNSKSANNTTGANQFANVGTAQRANNTTSTNQSADAGTVQSANSTTSTSQSVGNGTAQSASGTSQSAGSGTVQNTGSVSQTETAGKKKKGSALKIVLITAGIIIVIVAIAGAALYASGVIKVDSKPAVITPTPIPTQTPLENALDANNQTQTAPTEAPVQEPVQTENPLKTLKHRWQHTFVTENQYGSGELHIKVRSEEMVVITEIYYDYDGMETSRDKLTATFTSDKNTVIVDDYDGSTFYSASLSNDNKTISTVDKEGNAYGDFDRQKK